MIAQSTMFEPLLAACPSFQTKWELFLQDWSDEEELPLYLALSELARHLVRMLQNGEVESLRSVFRVVEDWLLSGDSYVKEAATVGLLEDLQNTNLHLRNTSPDDFVVFLLPETKYWWCKVIDFWETGRLIVDDRAG